MNKNRADKYTHRLHYYFLKKRHIQGSSENSQISLFKIDMDTIAVSGLFKMRRFKRSLGLVDLYLSKHQNPYTKKQKMSY